MKKRLLPLLTAAAILLTGCWQDLLEDDPGDLVVDDSAPTVPDAAPVTNTLPDSFALGWVPDITLDPLTCPDVPHLTIAALLYEGLFTLDETFQPQAVLCESWESDETMTVWTFRLRSGVLFSDSTALTAADVAASLNRGRETDRYRSRLADVQKITHSEDAVTVTLASPNALLPALLDIPIVKAGTEKNAVPTGTGPYAFAEDENGALLRPADTWCGTDARPVEDIRLYDCSGANTLRHQFTSRNVQLITADLTGQASFTPTGNVQVLDTDTTALQYIGFNTTRPLFADAAVRNALGLGIDRKTLAEAYLAGHALPAQSPVSPVSPLYPEALDVAYSAATFTEAMTAAGCCEGNIHNATLLVNEENSFKVAAARYLADALSVCDIRITVKALPWEEYTAALLAGDFDLYYGEVKLTADWDLSGLVGTGGALNYGGYTDAGAEYLLSSYASSGDSEDALLQLCRYLQSQAPILPLCFRRTSVLTQGGVIEGLSPTATDPFHRLGNITINLAESS